MKFIKRFWIKLKLMWVISKNSHIVILTLDEESVRSLFSGKGKFDVNVSYLGMQPYLNYKLIKILADSKTDIDMILMKAKFEAEALSENH